MQQAPQRLFHLLTVAFVVVASLILARIAAQSLALWLGESQGSAVMARPRPLVSETPRAIPPSRPPRDRNLFGTKPEPETAPTASAPVEPAPPAAPVNLTLVATGVLSGGRSFAMVEQNGDSVLYHVGEEVMPGVTLAEVQTDRVFVSRGKERIEVLLFADRDDTGSERQNRGPAALTRPSRRPGRPGVTQNTEGEDAETIRQVDDTSWIVDRREVEQATANLSQLITQIRVVPNLDANRQADGFKVFSIRPGSLFSKIGLRNGDILKEVNGIPMSGVDQAYQALTGLQGESSIQVNLVRQNEPVTLSYEIR